MMKIYRTQDKQLTRVDEIGEGCWVCLNNPDENEARLVASTLDIEPADLMAATDPEELGGWLHPHHRGHSHQGA